MWKNRIGISPVLRSHTKLCSCVVTHGHWTYAIENSGRIRNKNLQKHTNISAALNNMHIIRNCWRCRGNKFRRCLCFILLKTRQLREENTKLLSPTGKRRSKVALRKARGRRSFVSVVRKLYLIANTRDQHDWNFWIVFHFNQSRFKIALIYALKIVSTRTSIAWPHDLLPSTSHVCGSGV